MVDMRMQRGYKYGIFPPEECETEAPFDWTSLIERSPSIALLSKMVEESKVGKLLEWLGCSLARLDRHCWR